MFKRLNLSTTLATLLAVFAIFGLVSQGTGYLAISRTHEEVQLLNTLSFVQAHKLDATTEHLMNARIKLARAATRMAKGNEEPVTIVAYARDRVAQSEKGFAAFEAFVKALPGGEGRARALHERYAQLDGALKELVGFLDAGDLQVYLDQPTQKFQDNFLTECQHYADFVAQSAAASLAAIDRMHELYLWADLGLVVLLLILAARGYGTLKSALLRPLQGVHALFEAIADGRRENAIARDGRNEIGVLLSGSERMQDSICAIARTAKDAATQIAVDGTEIAPGNAELSYRTESHASSLHETSASVSTLSLMVKHGAGSARKASVLSTQAARDGLKNSVLTAGFESWLVGAVTRRF